MIKGNARIGRWAVPTIVVIAMVGGAVASSAVGDGPPRVADLTARLGPVPVQGGGTKRGVKGTYRLCDDGPPSSGKRSGLEEVTHRWSAGTRRDDMSLLVRERRPSISWDIYFRQSECRSRIFWSSTIPADVSIARSYPCYSVTLRVRDPGGRWSQSVTRDVKKCTHG
jgi:hypothetical protein